MIQYILSEAATQKLDKTKISMSNGSLMKDESIAECSAILLICIEQSSVLKQFWSFLVAALHRFYCNLIRLFFYEEALHKLHV